MTKTHITFRDVAFEIPFSINLHNVGQMIDEDGTIHVPSMEQIAELKRACENEVLELDYLFVPIYEALKSVMKNALKEMGFPLDEVDHLSITWGINE